MKIAKQTSILALGIALSACTTMSKAPRYVENGLEAVNKPVVARQDVALDLPVSGAGLGESGAKTLDSWFRSLELGYGDRVYVDGPGAAAAREDVADATSNYGLLLSNDAPVTAGSIDPGMVRVVVARTRATVPNCPNWSKPAQPSWQNAQTPGYGCAVNGALAAMIGNPEDLVLGRRAGVNDTAAAARSVTVHRNEGGAGSPTMGQMFDQMMNAATAQGEKK